MRAVAVAELGVKAEVQELPIPEPEPGEVRVRVHAASVNGFDLAMVAGYMQGYFEYRFPAVVGKDYAGVVDAVGADVTGFALGDRVFGTVTKPYLREGSYAEYTTVAQGVGIAPLPESISFEEGAALGLAGSAALAALAGAELSPGQVALVIGATGGVGAHVVQLAAAAGARVLATAHTDDEVAHLRSLGVRDIVDYGADLAMQVRQLTGDGADVVFHFAGDPAAALAAAKDGGKLVSLLVYSPDSLPSETVAVIPAFADPTPETLARLAENHRSGRTATPIMRRFPLNEAPEALAAFTEGTLGKIVITVD